jgi:hypothetical protein
MSLFRFEINQNWIRGFGDRFRRGKTNAVNKALDEIRRQWQLEFVRQRNRLSKSKWPPLAVDYLLRKLAERDSDNHPDVKYTTTLKRSGRMMDKYMQGIQVDGNAHTVTIKIPRDPYGRDQQGFRAFVHQGLVGRPKGVPIRAFELDKFERIGFQVLRDALEKND